MNLSDSLALSRAILRAIMASETDEDGVTSPSKTEISDPLEGYRQEEASDLFRITCEQYVTDREANTKGTANPSVMNKPFWMFQVGPGGFPAWNARTTFGNAEDPFADFEDPVWCFTRYGATRTKLPDGRVVCIAGEHEDGYDPDFCIYNGKPFPRAINRQQVRACFKITSWIWFLQLPVAPSTD